MEQTVLDVIRKEHAVIRNIMHSIENSEGKAKEDYFFNLKDEIVRHLRAEEHTIYPDLIKTTYVDHHEQKEYLQRLNLMDIHSVAWDEMFTRFKEAVEKHCKEEEEMVEQSMFKSSNKNLLELYSQYQSGAVT